MGRKHRKKIIEDDLPEEEHEDIEDDPSIWDNERYDHMYKTREKMLNFCKDKNIMLCEYLTVNTFYDFVDFLTEPFEE